MLHVEASKFKPLTGETIVIAAEPLKPKKRMDTPPKTNIDTKKIYA